MWFEFFLGIDTRGAASPPTVEGEHYTPLPYPLISRLLGVLDLTADDVFVDVGCGKGRVACCMSRTPVKKVVAVELNADLLEQTVENARRVRGRKAPMDFIHTSAEEYDYPDATVVYLYNPFNARLTAAVIDRLSLSFSRHHRPLRVVYANPVHEEVLERYDWLEKYHEWPATSFPVFGYPVSFWRAVQE